MSVSPPNSRTKSDDDDNNNNNTNDHNDHLEKQALPSSSSSSSGDHSEDAYYSSDEELIDLQDENDDGSLHSRKSSNSSNSSTSKKGNQQLRKTKRRGKKISSLSSSRRRRSSSSSSSRADNLRDNFDICSGPGLWNIVMRRTGLLVTLLLLQSLSQFILESYEHLISFHIVVPLFLTMLVGAGGNAGNQATVRVIAGLVTGQYSVKDTWRVLKSEIAIGLVNGVILAGIGFTRVYWMYEDGSGLFWSAMAITLSLFCIVITSAVLGTLLPFFLEYLGVDREMAAPAIQVFMDICGVLITCVVSSNIIPESEHSTPHTHGPSSPATTTEMPKTMTPGKK